MHGQYILPIQLVVERIEAIGRLFLRFGVQCPSAASESFSGVVRLIANLLCLPRLALHLELRPLPSTGITRLHQYYEPVRHPTRPSLLLTEFSVESHDLSTAGASRVSLRSPLPACRRHYPGGTVRMLSLIVSRRRRPSPNLRRVGSALPFSRPAQRSLTLRPACSPVA